jgi:hypothetical protein
MRISALASLPRNRTEIPCARCVMGLVNAVSSARQARTYSGHIQGIDHRAGIDKLGGIVVAHQHAVLFEHLTKLTEVGG